MLAASVGIDLVVKFSKFNLEAPFDYLFVHNDDYDPVPYTGKNLPPKTTLRIGRNEHRILCLRMKSDESITRTGFTATVRIQRQTEKWHPWSKCHTDMHPTLKRYFDGSCGVGVKHRDVICSTQDAKHNRCEKETVTEYCLKAKCEFTNHPKECFVYGDAHGECADGLSKAQQRKYSTKTWRLHRTVRGICGRGAGKTRWRYTCNAFGRTDPHYADPFKIYYSKKNSFDLGVIIARLQATRQKLVARYKKGTTVLTKGVLTHKYLPLSTEKIGHKLVRSLLLGLKFTMGITGSSNTAGHDNMFLSAYPMQLQALLRPLWVEIGYKRAAFQVRNHAIGGGTGTYHLKHCVLQTAGDDADVYWWEEDMNDHCRGPHCARWLEIHLRNSLSAKGNPVWHAMLPTHHCKRKNPPTADSPRAESGFRELLRHYKDRIGLAVFEPCDGEKMLPEFRRGQTFVRWHPSAFGHRFFADVIAYYYMGAAIDFITKHRQLIHRISPHGVPNNKLTKFFSDLDVQKHNAGKPLPKPGFCNASICGNSPSWCVTTFFPMMEQYHLKNYLVNPPKKGLAWVRIGDHVHWFSEKKGGEAPIDKKIQLYVSHTVKLKMNVHVVSNGIQFFFWTCFGSGLGNRCAPRKIPGLADKILVWLDGKKVQCQNKVHYLQPGCLLLNIKAGKHQLEMQSNEKRQFAVTHVVTF